jgi:hypothetical protein
MANTSLSQNSDSPFDSIRQVDEDGEFWMGRDLMPILGYPRWADFLRAIERAEISCRTLEGSSNIHFRIVTEMVKLPQGGSKRKIDYRLSRYAAYLTAMNGDPRKPQVAAAQSYFAVKTREAEITNNLPLAPPAQKSLPSAVEYVAAIKTISDLPRNRLTVLAEQLLVAEMAGIQNCLPSATNAKHYTTVMIRANQLGYSSKQIDGGVALGKYVKATIAPDHKDWQGQYQVWQYEVNEDLDARIHSFFLTRAL